MLAKCRNWLIFALKHILMYTLAYLFGPNFTRKDHGNSLKTPGNPGILLALSCRHPTSDADRCQVLCKSLQFMIYLTAIVI
jgi:hypothetical protein